MSGRDEEDWPFCAHRQACARPRR